MFSKPLREWASLYLDLGEAYLAQKGHAVVDASHCGVANELLAHTAVSAVVKSDRSLAEAFCSHIPRVSSQAGHYSNEWLYGRAGYLYLLRLVSVSFPDLKVLDEKKHQLVELIVSSPSPWTWHGKAYLGAVHGSIGIIAQVVMSDPSKASALESLLSDLLDQQLPSGNLPSSLERRDDDRLVQFCHGSPGFVISLLSIQPYSQKLEPRIKEAIEKARNNIWQRGLLTKEPCLCHGVAGNALALDIEQRNNFVKGMTSNALSEQWNIDMDSSHDAKALSLYGGEAGRAWVWGVLAQEKELGGIFLGFNDV